MRQEEIDSFFVKSGEEISLCGQKFIDLLQAVLERKVGFRFQVKGLSMSPFIKDSDIVTILPFNNGSVTLGQSVAFVHPCTKKLTIHRVIGRCKCSKHYIIKGDNTPEIDGAIPRENILGYVKQVERGKRKVFFGAGPERYLIVFLSKGKLSNLFFFGWRLIPFSVRQKIKLLI